MVIVDTTIWVDYFRDLGTPHTDWLHRELERQPLGVGDLILCEVLQGISDDRQAAEVQRQLTTLEVVPMCGTRTAVAAARNYRALRARGKTVRKTIDCLIATSCLLEGNTILHRDRDFDAFEQYLGLQVVHP